MTVCIAAIASATNEQGLRVPIVVLAGDRMITYGYMREYEQREQTKLFWLSPTVAVLVSGAGDAILEICRSAWLDTRDHPDLKVVDAAEILARRFREYRLRVNEHRILSRYGLTFQDFIQRQQEFTPTFFQTLLLELASDDANIGAACIVAGVDSNDGAIYIVRDPGLVEPRNMVAFAAIGIGGEHAESVFMGAEYTSYRRWTEALLLAYTAKKQAEVAPGVGQATDLYWIRRENHYYYEPLSPVQKYLQGLYDYRKNLEWQAFNKDHDNAMKFIFDWHAAQQSPPAEAAHDEASGSDNGLEQDDTESSEGDGQPPGAI